ncbi:acyl-CoA dehydrogenase family protein [Yinghuangia aomiensis]
MDFSEPEHIRSIRESVRQTCKAFDDEYWRRQDQQHEFPWDFYNAMAKNGWVGVAMPEEYGGGGGGITEASVVLEEVAAAGGADERCQRAAHLHVRDEPRRQARLGGNAREVPAAGRARVTCTSRSASPSRMPARTRRRSRLAR